MKSTLFFILLLTVFGCKPEGSYETEITFRDVSSRGYTHGVSVDEKSKTTVYISGQVPVDESGNIVGKGSLALQTEQVFKNIKRQVEQAGGTMSDVVNIDCYFTDISEIAEFRKGRDKYINLKNPPASTAVEVQRLINEDFLIEINAIAVIVK